VTGLKLSENHLRDFMDWLEEIALRDGFAVHQIIAHRNLGEILSDHRLGRADKLKRIKDQLRRWRFPRLTQTEDRIQAWIRDLKLPSKVRIFVPPGLEGGELHVEITVATHEELKQLSARLAETAAKASVGKIFDALAGREVPDQAGGAD
jgi:hypothetical protein